jgi:hypothetical protein
VAARSWRTSGPGPRRSRSEVGRALTLERDPAEGRHAKWANHRVAFRDDGETDNHHTDGHWGGIVAVMRAAVAANAR